MSLTAVAVIFWGDKALLLKRGSTAPWMPGLWNLPGGGVDEGEGPYEAVLRELKEEAGIELLPKDITLLYMIHDIIAFVGKVENPAVNINYESDDYRWLERADMDSFDFVFPVSYILDSAYGLLNYREQS